MCMLIVTSKFNPVLAHGTGYLDLITLMEGEKASLSPYNSIPSSQF